MREAVPGGADHRLGRAADPDPGHELPVFQVRDHVLLDRRRPGGALPGDRAALEELGEERGLLLEQDLVVVQVVAEERERVDRRSPPEDGPNTSGNPPAPTSAAMPIASR